MSLQLTRRLAAALLSLASAAAPSAAAPPGSPSAVPASLACGPLRVTVSGAAPAQQVQFAEGTTVLATAAFEPEGNIVGVQCRADVAGPRPAVLVSNYTGGMHCCYTLSVYTTTPFRRVLAFDNNSIGWKLHPGPGGTQALVLNDGHFDYYDNLSHVWAPSVIPLVACYRGGRFVECTKEFPDVISACEHEYTADLIGHDRYPMSPEDAEPAARGAALGLYLCRLIRGEASVDAIERLMARDLIEAASAPRVAAWLRSHSAEARRWIASRAVQLLAPPSGYSRGSP